MEQHTDAFGPDDVKAFAKRLAERIPELAQDANDFKRWTRAVYDALKEFQVAKGCTITPADRCYAGEYLCDFMLFQPGYGCRIACESQWEHWGRHHQSQLDWAFDKLRGVKADVKLFIFEGSEQEWNKTHQTYLLNYAQLSQEEIYIALRWVKPRFACSVWIPQKDGLQDSVVFQDF